MSLVNVRLGTKLLLLATAGLLSSVLTATVGYFGMAAGEENARFTAERIVPSLAIVARLNDEIGHIERGERNFVAARSEQDRATIEKSLQGFRGEVDTLLGDYEKTVDDDKERLLFAQVRSSLETFRLSLARTMATAASAQAHDDLLNNDLLASREAFDDLGEALDVLFDYDEKSVATAHTAAKAAGDRSNVALIAIALVAASGLILLAIWLTRGVVRQLGGEPLDVIHFAKAIAGGNLGFKLALRPGDTDSIVATMQAMCDRLNEIVSNVRTASSSVSNEAAQLSQGNDDLSHRTQEQAAALEQTASSMEQMTVTVKQNADNARQANQLATLARTNAERGAQVAADTAGAMSEINASSRKIADIIGVIDEIAFQTNLLALNAAVEAARAGEQGRGFAVVASEVRNLAQRSAGAAKQIKELIGDSVGKVRAGTALVDESGKVLSEIMGSIKKVSDFVAEIASASEEQANGLEQVNQAVSQMDDATQQNAALVEEAAAAAKSMEQQAQTVVVQMSFFQTQSSARSSVVIEPPAVLRQDASITPLSSRLQSGAEIVHLSIPSARRRASGSSGNW